MPSVIINSVGVKATGTITVTNFNNDVGDVITVNGITLTEGVQWTTQTSNNVTATNIAAAITTATATTLCTATATLAVVTITANTAGTAGNSITTTISDGLGLSVQQAALTGGTAGAPVDGTLSTAPIRLRNIRVKSTGTLLGVRVLNGGSTGTEYDLVTGTTGTTVVRNYVKGLTLPAGGYVTLGADVTQVAAQFDLI